MRKIIKIVTFYDDGTFTESIPAVSAPLPNIPVTPLATFTKCSKCGLNLETVMGYVCNNYPCPTGLGGAWCSTNE
jgi:hypothetical protein